MKILTALIALTFLAAWVTGHGVELFEFCAHQIGSHIHQQHQQTRTVQMGTGE